MVVQMICPSLAVCTVETQQGWPVFWQAQHLWLLFRQAPYAEAVAVSTDGRIAAVGNMADLAPYKLMASKVVDLQGRWLMPVRLCPDCPESDLHCQSCGVMRIEKPAGCLE